MENQVRKVKSVEFEVIIAGNGLVNFNGKDNRSLNHKNSIYENVKYAKEHVYLENGVQKARKIISSNLLRKEILGDVNLVSTKLINENKELRIKVLSDRRMLNRGFLFADTDDKMSKENKIKNGKITTTIKRKSPICITAAEQIDDNDTTVEFCTGRDMTQNTETEEWEKSTTSIYSKETTGSIKYKTTVCIDIKNLQFVSLDDRFDRLTIIPTDVLNVITEMNKKGYEARCGSFLTNNNEHHIAEQGIVFGDKYVKDSVLDVTKSVMNFKVNRSDAWAKIESVSYKFLYSDEDVIDHVKKEYIPIENYKEFANIVEKTDIGYDFEEGEHLEIN